MTLILNTDLVANWGQVQGQETWHGPKQGCPEAGAEAVSLLEAEALTLFKLEAKALVMKPKPGYL